MRATTWIFGASVGAHLALGLGIGTLRAGAAHHGATAISMGETKKKPPPKTDTPPPPPKSPDPPNAPRRAAKAKAAAEAKPPPDAPAPKSAAQAAAMDALPDFGLSLSGGVGPGGLAIPAQAAGPRAAEPQQARAKAAPAAAPKPVDDCSEPLVKPRPESVPQPAYTPAARDANVQGRVRVEVSVDASGRVTAARLLSGLGYGLDEAALAAARSATFSPATRCGKPAATTFVIAMRFSL